MATAKMRKHFILEGQVQGVGLRFRAEYATQMIPVTGYEIHYYGFGRPSFRDFVKPAGENWRVEVIDTWNMTITDAGVHSGKFCIALPGHEYMAVRLTRV